MPNGTAPPPALLVEDLVKRYATGVEALKGVAFPKLAQDKAEAEIQLTLPTPQRS